MIDYININSNNDILNTLIKPINESKIKLFLINNILKNNLYINSNIDDEYENIINNTNSIIIKPKIKKLKKTKERDIILSKSDLLKLIDSLHEDQLTIFDYVNSTKKCFYYWKCWSW
ncbi:MAG: hypothetical protein U5L02_01780 [Rheinheimera sp.]|nr:hypothetical protein [Rheinheimera sp.]